MAYVKYGKYSKLGIDMNKIIEDKEYIANKKKELCGKCMYYSTSNNRCIVNRRCI